MVDKYVVGGGGGEGLGLAGRKRGWREGKDERREGRLRKKKKNELGS